MTPDPSRLPPVADDGFGVGTRGDAVESGTDGQLRDELSRATAAISELRLKLAEGGTGGEAPIYGLRVATLLGRRVQDVEASVGVALALTERTGAELREELRAVAADLAARLDDVARSMRETATETAHAALLERIVELERDRDAMATRLEGDADAWAAERAALQERVAELTARIVTGPATGSTLDDGSAAPPSRELDQLRIGVEGLRMRLAYHEKSVAELAGGGINGRIHDLHDLLRRLEHAGSAARHERESVMEHIEHLASRLDRRIEQLEAPPART